MDTLFDSVNGLVVDGPLKGQVLGALDGGAEGFGHCDNNDESTYKHYSWHPLKAGEKVKNPIDERPIHGYWKLDEMPSEIIEIDGKSVRGTVLGERKVQPKAIAK